MQTGLNYKKHWDSVYESKEDSQLGWFENYPETTLKLIDVCHLKPDANILNVGAGTTTLIGALLDKGFTNIIANDLSTIALQKLQDRILKKHKYHLKCIVDDLTNPQALLQLNPVDLWIDRAVLHFFLSEIEQETYFNTLKSVISKNGFVLIAVFSLHGAKKCSGLDLQGYNVDMLQHRLGHDFKLISSIEQIHLTPSGEERPYVYTLFQKK